MDVRKSISTLEINSTKPRHILEEIVWHKRKEVASMSKQLSFADLQNQISTAPPLRDFLDALRQNPSKPSLIAEVKKASPSKGVIRADFDPVKIAQAYEQGGASCLSVLTDQKFFEGSFENLRLIRKSVGLPLLCKEFIIDPYQIYFARVNGADAVLLIAAILSNEILADFLQIVRHLGMTALVEVHTLVELDRVLALLNVQLIGINNRNLEDFNVELETTQCLLKERREQLSSSGITVVSESGLYTSADLAFVVEAGAEAVLIGESLVKQTDLEQAVKKLMNK
ncbi:MAG: indole-3-glycerol phosphate synthase TrpC [Pelatocladus maniniholoensis HA4357-MV3]|jgi:indole-3-glycerol phosphate synthase|uniref:Indole-3-glycerol phosphate synthase n=1 Tax=Pelatocladus maniniholoensis HA4357-MV3 TaxID=1117104 RepID=A0A9E3LVV3_9NOST|nr:indole-3-glycerol phosphate synthase TrpC [Pelatocladus maniniholoensis HA4357-MV3]